MLRLKVVFRSLLLFVGYIHVRHEDGAPYHIRGIWGGTIDHASAATVASFFFSEERKGSDVWGETTKSEGRVAGNPFRDLLGADIMQRS
jgi:hypothetical protein